MQTDQGLYTDDKEYKHKGAGILPRINDYYLLGLEKYSGKWSAFSGRAEKGETPFVTACREAYEESCGLITLENCTDVTPIKDGDFVLFVVDLTDEIDVLSFDYLQEMNKNPCFNEKTSIKWFHKDQLRNIKLRKCFKRIVHLLNT
tara:strand:+ start:577 stop:1014 length:438 start_codon:yes stop_codon:yes gene_type:complete